jgi:hypothetical protein
MLARVLPPLFLPVAVGAVMGGQVIAKVERYHFLAVIGALILLTGLFLLVCMDTTAVLLTMTLNMIVVGLGMGIIQPIYTVAGQNAIAQERLGVGTGAINYLRAMDRCQVRRCSVQPSHIRLTVQSQPACRNRHGRRSRRVLSTFFWSLVGWVRIAVFIMTLLLKDVRLRKRGEGTPMRDTNPAMTASPVNDGAKRRSHA